MKSSQSEYILQNEYQQCYSQKDKNSDANEIMKRVKNTEPKVKEYSNKTKYIMGVNNLAKTNIPFNYNAKSRAIPAYPYGVKSAYNDEKDLKNSRSRDHFKGVKKK